MTDDLRDRVRGVLADAEERLESFDAGGDGEDGASEAFEDVAERANDLVSNTDPAELLEAVGSDEWSEGERPESLPEAMAKSAPGTVVALRKVLALSKMADAEDGALAEHVGAFRKLTEEHDGENGEDERETAEAREAGDDTLESSASDEASGSSEETERTEQLREALRDGIENFRKGVRSTRGELEGEESDGEDEESEADEEVEVDQGSSDGDGTMFSTVPSRDRADMRSSTRFSTVRKR